MLYQVETQPVIAQTVLLVDMAMRNRCRMRCALGRVCQVSIALAIPLMSKVKVVQLGLQVMKLTRLFTAPRRPLQLDRTLVPRDFFAPKEVVIKFAMSTRLWGCYFLLTATPPMEVLSGKAITGAGSVAVIMMAARAQRCSTIK